MTEQKAQDIYPSTLTNSVMYFYKATDAYLPEGFWDESGAH
jgi:hypothetical protein